MLELRHVTCGYGKDMVLRDISVRINERELVGVIGPNGSGKTTLMRAMTKVIKPAAGEVLLDGKDINAVSYRDLARQVAVVTRPAGSDANLRVEDLVLLGRIPHRQGYRITEREVDVEAASAAMKVTGVFDLRDRLVDSLSSGERQLAFIARALAQEPRLLFLDEPTSHLDIGRQVSLLHMVTKLNREKGLTVVMILHDLNLASQYCRRLLLLDRGILRAEGPPASVLTRETIEDVYRTPVVVLDNPVSLKPFIQPVPEEVEITFPSGDPF